MGDASGPAGTPAGVNLPADALARAFPFHIVCDAALAVRQCGVSLRKLLPDVGPGRLLGEAFTAFRPAATLSPELLESLEETLVLIEHRATGVRMRGEFVRTGEPGHWMFLGSPWFPTNQEFEATNLTLDDFAPHDSAIDILLIGQTRQIAIDDLQRLTARLGRQREALRRTEAVYRAAFAAAGGVAYQEDLVHDRFAYAGDGFREMVGCEPGELRPSQLRRSEAAAGSANVEDDTTWIRAGDGQIRRRIEYPFTTAAGEIRWISDSSVLVADDAGRPVSTIGMLTDITSRKQAEQRLRESEEETQRLALVAAKTNNIVMLFDASRRIEWVNEGFTRLVGYSLAEVRGGVARDFLRTDLADPRRHQEVLAALERGEPFLGDILGQRRDGSPLWLKVDMRANRDAQGRVLGFLGVGTDITDLKTYERRLAQLRDELDAVLRVIPGGVVAFDEDGRVAYCNAAFERIVGLSRDTLFGMSYPKLDRVLAGLCDPGEPPGRFADLGDEGSDQIQIIRPSPATVVRSVRATAGDEARRPWRVFYLRDVTRQVEQERMKDEFLSMAAHELRTPMSSVHGFAELLMSRDFDAATSRNIAATIHRQSSLLVDMVNDLLDLARIESGQGQDFELAVQSLVPIARETVAGLIVPGDTRSVAIIEPDCEPPTVSVDPARLRQALTNVLSNAYKYSRGRGAIRMSFPVTTRLGVRWAGILVEDEGIGMTPEQLRRVFDRFYRADRSGAVPGTGLGMPLAQEIMERMNGLIEVSSEAGKGTRVTLWLPASAG